MNRLFWLIIVALLVTPAVANAQEAHVFLQGRVAVVPDGESGSYTKFTGVEALSYGRANLDVIHFHSPGFWLVEVTPSVSFSINENLTLKPGPLAIIGEDGLDPGINLGVTAFGGKLTIPVLGVSVGDDGKITERVIANLAIRGWRATAQTFGPSWQISGGHTLPVPGPITPELRGTVNEDGLGVEFRASFFH